MAYLALLKGLESIVSVLVVCHMFFMVLWGVVEPSSIRPMSVLKFLTCSTR
jgi:hypothetical protein